jgi:hypothetical protein
MNVKTKLGLLLTILAVAVPAVLWYFDVLADIFHFSPLILVLAVASAILIYRGACAERRWFLGASLLICDCLLILFCFLILSGEPPARISFNQSFAASTVRCLATVNVAYKDRNSHYASKLPELDGWPNACLTGEMEEVIKKGTAKGYVFNYSTSITNGFQITAAPKKPGKTGNTSFYADQQLTVRYDLLKPATSQSPALEN